MLRNLIQLIRTAAVIRKLLALGMFREVRVMSDARGLRSLLFVEYCGVQSIVGLDSAKGLAQAQKRMDKRKWGEEAWR